MTPQEVVNKMLENDHFSKWLGITVDEVSEGYCALHFTVKKEMLNGFSSIHGGALFAAADSAFAFACNSEGKMAVALDVNISYTRPAQEGEVLKVVAQQINQGKTTGIYEVKITNAAQKLVALFKGTSFRTGKEF